MSRRRFPLFEHPAYVRFWLADAVSMLGSSVTGLALQVLAVVTLHAGGTEVGVLNAAQRRTLDSVLKSLLIELEQAERRR